MCLPMGCSTSCQTFESFSQAVQWICVHKAKILHISHIIDDFIFFGKTISRCQLYLDRFFEICRMINIPIKHSKTMLPTSRVVLHGIGLDSVAQTIQLPQDKLSALRAKLITMSKRKKASLREVPPVFLPSHFAWQNILSSPHKPNFRQVQPQPLDSA